MKPSTSVLCRSAVAIISILPLGDLWGQGAVYTKSADAPRPTKTPVSITLLPAPGSESAVVVRASLAQIRLDRTATKGTVAFTGSLSVFRKFVRCDIRVTEGVAQPASLKVKYTFKEGDAIEAREESVIITEKSPAYVVDFEGFEDETGTEVKNTSSIFSSTSTRYKYFNAEIVSVEVTVADAAGNSLFMGAWPKPASEVVSLPEYLKPRVFTDLQGREIEAVVEAVGDETATLLIGGKSFDVQLSTLTEADRAYLEKLRPSSR